MGSEATRTIVGDPKLNATKVVVLTTFDDDQDIQEAIRAGAAGYLLKDISPEETATGRPRGSVGARHCYRPPLPASVMQQLAAHTVSSTTPHMIAELTDREREILLHIGFGEFQR